VKERGRMSTHTGLVIEVSGDTKTIGWDTQKEAYDKISEAVGGYIEAVRIHRDLILYCNEEGKLDGLLPNLSATRLVRAFAMMVDADWPDFLVGNVVVVGTEEDNADDTGVSDEWLSILTALLQDMETEEEVK